MKISQNNDNNIIHKIPDEQNSTETCIPQEILIKDVRLARAYVPIQKFCSTFCPLEALNKGTSFPELYMPYRQEFEDTDSSNG